MKKLGILLLGVMLLGATGCAKKTIVDLKPNETAFITNNFADSKDDKSQSFNGTREDWGRVKSSSKMIIVEYDRISTGSIPYINSKKIPQKKVIVVSQGIVAKDWVGEKDRGTSSTNQAIMGESANGAEFHLGITLSARISDPELYLSVYGVDPKSDINDVRVNSLPLGYVLDTTIRYNVQGELHDEFSQYQTFDIQPKKSQVMKAVSKRIKDQLAKEGITLLSFNSSDNVTWDDGNIQKAINEKAQLEAKHQKVIVEQAVEKKEAETRRLVKEQESMATARAIELQAESQRKQAEINRLKARELNQQLLEEAQNKVLISREKSKIISVDKQLLAIEEQRVNMEVKKIEAQTKLEEARKWNGKRPYSEVTIQGANSIVGKDGAVKTMNLVQ